MTGYESPLGARYASAAMQSLFTPRARYTNWRKLWAALARAQHELGLGVSAAQVAELEAHIDDLNEDAASRHERATRHEVMAQIRALAEQAPTAAPIIHLGATSAYVMDNGDLLTMRDALRLTRSELAAVLKALAERAVEFRDLPVLGYTHYQPAQLTTLGKRVCMWAQDFLFDLKAVERLIDTLPFLGMKGATGTAASVLALVDGDAGKAVRLDRRVAELSGFSSVLPVSGQTYTRKIDTMVYSALAGIAESAGKMAGDIRLLQHDGEVLEPFGREQVGSSAMPYKRNPMKCERIAALSRLLITMSLNGPLTASSQWLERTLDDSANKRIACAECFLLADSVLRLAHEVARGFEAMPDRIAANVARELPFIATENILMMAVRAGGDRQSLHDRLRVHSIAAQERILKGAADNDLLMRLARDPAFEAVAADIALELDPTRYVGLAPIQVDEFLSAHLRPAIPDDAPPDPWGGHSQV